MSARPQPTLTPAEIALVRSLVIFEDAHILALNKPAGLSSQGGRGQVNTLDELLFAFAKSSGNRPRLIDDSGHPGGLDLGDLTRPPAGAAAKAFALPTLLKRAQHAVCGVGAGRADHHGRR